ncbi:nucleotide-diphospho-sugar transferase [Hysterangium stoloniferum]|nr:nucleotide-diphospho-sugar transferase [Hysterangium stoloniferum]
MITSMRYVLLVLGIILLERKERAAFVILARNGDLYGVLSSMKQMEDRFNKIFQYPYVFLNEIPFSGDFKSLTALTRYATEITGSPINEEKVAISRENMVQNQLIHGGSDHSDFVEHNKKAMGWLSCLRTAVKRVTNAISCQSGAISKSPAFSYGEERHMENTSNI